MTVKNPSSHDLWHPHWHPAVWGLVWLAATAIIFLAITGYLFIDKAGG